MSKRKVLFIVIIVICIIAVNYAIYWQFFKKKDVKDTPIDVPIVEEGKILKDFNSIFKNEIDYQIYDIQGLSKVDNSKDMIYTKYENKEKEDNNYALNVNIPAININSNVATNINNEIENIFQKKVVDILNETEQNTIYTVEYQAYINSNILSLVIKSTLKEADMPQRVIVKTYVYNLSANEVLTLPKVLEFKSLSEDGVRQEIKNKIEEANNEANKLKDLGYNIYKRNVNDSMYEIENTTNFFLGENNMLYVLYPYGNMNSTSEIDIIVFE